MPKTDKKIIIHCQKGKRGENACAKLLAEKIGIPLYNIEGGIEAWQNAGLSVVAGDKKILPLDRQVQLVIGVMLIMLSLLTYFIHPAFAFGTAFIGAGLTNAGLTGWCGLGKIMAMMPWNH